MISDKTIIQGNKCIVGIFFIYGFSMLIYPWLAGGFEWDYVHSVWYTWQSFNVGVLAFSSSVIVFNISRYHAERKRERDFVAERALLPQALSDLCTYFKICVPVISEGYSRCSLPRHERKLPLESKLPILISSHVLVFQNCIRVADRDVGDNLASILSDLQVNSARLESMYNSFSSSSSTMQAKINFINHLFYLAKLQVQVNKLFKFSRGESNFDNSVMTIEEFSTSYHYLGIFDEEFDGLWEFTEKWVKSQSNT